MVFLPMFRLRNIRQIRPPPVDVNVKREVERSVTVPRSGGMDSPQAKELGARASDTAACGVSLATQRI